MNVNVRRGNELHKDRWTLRVRFRTNILRVTSKVRRPISALGRVTRKRRLRIGGAQLCE